MSVPSERAPGRLLRCLAIALLCAGLPANADGVLDGAIEIVTDPGAGDGWGDVLRREAAAGRLLPLVSDYIPDLDAPLAYAIQRAFVAGGRRPPAVAGFKAGFTGNAGRERFGIDGPVSGVLLAGGARESGATVALDATPGLLVEVELGFVLRSAIRRPMRSVLDLSTYVREVRPVIELPALRFAAADRVTGYDLVAGNVAANLWIAGDPLRLRHLGEANDIAVTLSRDGKVLAEGRGSDALGNQGLALLWLVNHLHQLGWPLEAGQLLITGTLGAMVPAAPGTWRAQFGERATLEFTLLPGREAQASSR